MAIMLKIMDSNAQNYGKEDEPLKQTRSQKIFTLQIV
jgi:hypothetical protein